MSAPPETPGRVALRRGGAIEVAPQGVLYPLRARTACIPWAELLHVEVGPRGLRLSTRRGVQLVRRSEFADRLRGPETAAAAVRSGAADTPGGAPRRARMDALDALAGRSGPAPVTWALASVCAVLFPLAWLRPEVHYAGLFSPELVGLHELWRLVTANLLHASPAHLLLNLGGLVVLGWLAERVLGRRGALLVVGLSALLAMGASWARGYDSAVGASGIVYGLAGALVWLELFRPDALPASWRIPRVALLGLLGIETLFLLQLSFVAHAAHWGGFAGGALGAALAGPRVGRRGDGRLLGAAAFAVGLVFVVALAALARSVVRDDPAALAARGERLLALEAIDPVFLNNEAWRIATAPDADPAQLGVARRMAERAVRETRGLDPPLLDTLAEILFRLGESGRAVDVIDAAIALEPDEAYYREQRLRFLGERDRDDRPPAPSPSPSRPEREPPPGAIRV